MTSSSGVFRFRVHGTSGQSFFNVFNRGSRDDVVCRASLWQYATASCSSCPVATLHADTTFSSILPALSPDIMYVLALSNWNTALAYMFAVGWSPPSAASTGCNTSVLCMRSSAHTENVPSGRNRGIRNTMRRCDRSTAATTSGPRMLHDRVSAARVHVDTAWYTWCTVVLESDIDHTWCTVYESCTHVLSMCIPTPPCNIIYVHTLGCQRVTLPDTYSAMQILVASNRRR